MKNFPKKFLWGTAHSSHQVEGNNTNNDWWEWEEKGKTKERSGWACDSWNRYIVDHDLVEELGCNAFRLSLEWSRIEPEEGGFSQDAIEHYRKVLADLGKRGIKRVVTLHHFTLPLWFSHQYGWHHPGSVEAFERYSEKVINELGDEIDMVVPINEPRIIVNKGYLQGVFPPGKHNPLLFIEARNHLAEAHRKCYAVIKAKKPDLPIGITQFCNDFRWRTKTKIFKKITEKVENFYNWHFFDKLKGDYDFIGINYYFGVSLGFKLPFVRMIKPDGVISDMGWGIHPAGLQEILKDAWRKYEVPIYIFENGIADAEDKHRTKFIKKHLKAIASAINEGADVRGYFHWALIDNFEWAEGFSKRFGLCEMDYQTMERKPRPSFYEYQKIIKERRV